MADDLDLPIALRRARRSSTAATAELTIDRVEITELTQKATSRTPRTQRFKKRVRFSDPGPSIDSPGSQSASSTSGLTPMVRRTSLAASPSTKRRRRSMPCQRRAHDEKTLAISDIPLPSLRQILDGRAERCMRRNGMSEEMNNAQEGKRRKRKDDAAEIQRLKAELEAKDEEIDQLRDAAHVQDSERILELETQLEKLRQELHSKSTTQDQTPVDWTLAARDPFSDSFMDMDTDGFGDSTVADLACSTPSRGRRSFPTPPSTSPFMPATPCSNRRMPLTPQSHHSVQASLPDPEKVALEAELCSLRLELSKLADALESQAALKARISERLNTVSITGEKAQDANVEGQLDGVLRTLSDRTAALLDLNSSLSALGFPGKDASEVISSLSSAFRSARLELEYLTPGEITLPLSSHGAEVLDLVLARLRELARKVRENEDSIDEYHALELSLRQQLGARVQAMDGMSLELTACEKAKNGKDARIADLEVGIDRLKGAVEDYRRDITELEELVQRMEEEGKKKEAELQVNLDTSQARVRRKEECISELESKLASVLSQTEKLKKQVQEVEAKKAADIAAINKDHGSGLALRDARVYELRGEIERVNEGLRKAHETILQLRVENMNLNSRVELERNKAQEAVDSMKAEMERVLQMSQSLLATPQKKKPGHRRSNSLEAASVAGAGRRSSRSSTTTTPESEARAGSFLSGDLAKKGKKRRRYDSGLGFLDEDEVDLI